MIAAFKMGLVGGQRAMTPLAIVAVALARGELPARDSLARLLGQPLVAVGAVALAIAEMAGDKQKTAPDRTVPIGLAARFVTSAMAGAVLVPKRERIWGAAVAGATAVAAAWPGWRLRMAALRRHGQTPTGFVEDVAVLATAARIVRSPAAVA